MLYSEWGESFEVPYKIGTFIESKDNPSIRARIIQYRITVKDYKPVILVGLNTDIYTNKEIPDTEISMKELEEKWKILYRTSIGVLDPNTFLRIEDTPKQAEIDTKLELTHQKEKEEIERLQKELNVSISDLETLRMMKRLSDTYDEVEQILQEPDKHEKKEPFGFRRR